MLRNVLFIGYVPYFSVVYSLNVLIFILVFFCSFFFKQMHAFAFVLSLSVLGLHPANLMTLTRNVHALWLLFYS